MLPIWSAAADPRVLAVRAVVASGPSAYLFGVDEPYMRVVRGPSAEHVLMLRHGTPARLDVIAGKVAAGSVILHFNVAADDRLPAQIEAIRSFSDAASPSNGHEQFGRRLLALHAVDARMAGASLREIADLVLGPGDWPGDGEHRKSLVRRLVTAGDRMIRAGPRSVLGHGLAASTKDHG